jgi:hypothetical protein
MQSLRSTGATLAVAASLLFCAPGFGSPSTGADLLLNCTQHSDDLLEGYCSGFIQGVAQALSRRGDPDHICLPGGTDPKTLHRLVVDALRLSTQEQRNRDAGELVVEALTAAYRCH